MLLRLSALTRYDLHHLEQRFRPTQTVHLRGRGGDGVRVRPSLAEQPYRKTSLPTSLSQTLLCARPPLSGILR